MILLVVVGILVIISGAIFLSGEKNVRAVNKALTDLINTTVVSLDEVLLKFRVGTGISLVAIGVFCLFIAYWLSVMAPKGFRIF